MLRGSNPRPPPCKGDALPAELSIRSEDTQDIIYHYEEIKSIKKSPFSRATFC